MGFLKERIDFSDWYEVFRQGFETLRGKHPPPDHQRCKIPFPFFSPTRYYIPELQQRRKQAALPHDEHVYLHAVPGATGHMGSIYRRSPSQGLIPPLCQQPAHRCATETA